MIRRAFRLQASGWEAYHNSPGFICNNDPRHSASVCVCDGVPKCWEDTSSGGASIAPSSQDQQRALYLTNFKRHKTKM